MTGSAEYWDLYNALTQAGINLGFTTSQRDTIEEASQAVEITGRPSPRFVIRNAAGDALAIFDENGNLCVAGTLIADVR